MKKKKETNSEGQEYNLKNHECIYKYIAEKLSWIKNIKYITGIATTSEWRLTLQQHTVAGPKYKYKYNELHDYTGTDENEIKEIKEISNKIVNSYYCYCNPLAFMQMGAAIFYNILKVLIEQNKDTIVSVDSFTNDPILFSPLFDGLEVPNRNFYFANDKRGTRNYEYFPISELQHLVYDIQYNKENHECTDINELFIENEEPQEKYSNNFIFMGSILYLKGNRINLWKQYLKDFYYDKSAFYIPPIKNGVIFKSLSEKHIKSKQKTFTDVLENTWNEIKNHSLYKGYILPYKVNEEIEKYKYSFIMRCVSCNDSLNYRPVLLTYHKVLFFLDPGYDPSYLQIPKYIQDKIIVHNSEDIKNKIEYFEQHPEEREQILNELWKHFNIDKWLEPDYYKQVIFEYYK